MQIVSVAINQAQTNFFRISAKVQGVSQFLKQSGSF